MSVNLAVKTRFTARDLVTDSGHGRPWTGQSTEDRGGGRQGSEDWQLAVVYKPSRLQQQPWYQSWRTYVFDDFVEPDVDGLADDAQVLPQLLGPRAELVQQGVHQTDGEENTIPSTSTNLIIWYGAMLTKRDLSATQRPYSVAYSFSRGSCDSVPRIKSDTMKTLNDSTEAAQELTGSRHRHHMHCSAFISIGCDNTSTVFYPSQY